MTWFTEHIANFDWGNVILAWVCLAIGATFGIWWRRPAAVPFEAKPCICGNDHDGWDLIAEVRAQIAEDSRKDADRRSGHEVE